MADHAAMGMNMWLKKGAKPLNGAKLLGLDRPEATAGMGLRERMRHDQEAAHDKADGL